MKLNPKPTARINLAGELCIDRWMEDDNERLDALQYCPFNERNCDVECPLLKITPNEIILGCASGVYWKREKGSDE